MAKAILWAKTDAEARKRGEQTGLDIVADLDIVGKNLRGATDSYEKAYNKLATGKGNLLSRVEGIRALGVKTAKRLNVEESEQEQIES